MAKIGEDALANMAKRGVEELRSANAGVAMEAQPIRPSEAPAVEPPSYADLLSQQASMSEGRGESQEQGMSR